MALTYAIRFGNVQECLTLIENGAEVHNLDDQGNSALHLAVLHNVPQIIPYLNVNPDLPRKDGKKPIDLASQEHLEVLKELMIKDCDLNPKLHFEGKHLLSIACDNRYMSLIDAVCKKVPKGSLPQHLINACFTCAFKCKNSYTIQVLVEHGYRFKFFIKRVCELGDVNLMKKCISLNLFEPKDLEIVCGVGNLDMLYTFTKFIDCRKYIFDNTFSVFQISSKHPRVLLFLARKFKCGKGTIIYFKYNGYTIQGTIIDALFNLGEKNIARYLHFHGFIPKLNYIYPGWWKRGVIDIYEETKKVCYDAYLNFVEKSPVTEKYIEEHKKLTLPWTPKRHFDHSREFKDEVVFALFILKEWGLPPELRLNIVSYFSSPSWI